MRNFKDLFNYGIGVGLPVILGFLWIPMLTRILSQEEFGTFSFLNQSFLFLSTLLLIGTYFIQTNKEFNDVYYKKIGQLNRIITILSLIILFMMEVSIIEAIVISILLYLYADFQNKIVLLNVNFESKKYAKFQSSYSIGKVLIGLSFVIIFKSYIFIFIGMIIVLYYLNILLNKSIRNIPKDEGSCDKKNTLLEILKLGVPLTLFSIAVSLILTIDFYFFNRNNMTYELAIYSGNVSLISSIFAIPLTILTLFIIPRYRTTNSSNEKKKNYYIMITANLVMLFILIVVFYLGKFLLHGFLLPTDYKISFQLMVLVIVFAFMINILKQNFLYLQFNNFRYFKLFLIILYLLLLGKIIILLFEGSNFIFIIVLNIIILFIINIATFVFIISKMKRKAIVSGT